MKDHEFYFKKAAKVALKSLCLRKKGGSVIVKNGEIIGQGYIAPPADDISGRRCLEERDLSKKPKYDKTCCMHAEWRAIMDALKNHPDEIKGSSLYFIHVGEDGELKKSGEPFCTDCSRLALDVRLKEFGLWHEEGIKMYGTKEYNNLSYNYYSL